MNRYSEYKDSGVEWIGEIPSHWMFLPLKFLVETPVTDGPHETPEFIDNGVPFLSVESVVENKLVISRMRGYISRELHEEYSKKCKPRRNDIFLVKSGSTTGKSAIVETDEEFNVWSPLCLIRSNTKKIRPQFFFQSLQSGYFRKSVELAWSFGTQPNIGMNVIENLKIILPTLNEQTLISQYLDKKTSQIDSLIEKIERKIELLKEQRTSLINQCVTKGLNPDVEMKDSGIEWIGEIPSHWKVKRLKYFSSVELSSVDRHIVEDEIPVDVCHYTQVYKNEKINKTTKLSKGTCTPQELKKFSLFKGDILLTKDSESPDDIGIPTFIEEVLEGTVCGYHLCHIRVLEREMNPEFLYRFIESTTIQRYFSISSNGVTRFGLGKSTIENVPILLPPPVDQQTIADKINRFSTLILSTISKETKRIELLKEYRQSLVSNVVTGKVKITEEKI